MMADFQDFFLTLFWRPWTYMLGLYVAMAVITAIYHGLLHAHTFYGPRKRSTFAGQEVD